MQKKSAVLAIIPARGGSKGIPHKNIRLLAGHPLISYSIAAAQEAKRVNRVIVSTDDQEIAEIAREYGCEVPFFRPSDLAKDDTRDLPVFQHALRWLKESEGYEPEAVVHLRPTSPTRKRGSIDSAVQLLLGHPEADSVRSVIIPDQNPYKMWKIKKDGFMDPLISVEGVPESYNAPRQVLPPAYWHNGQIDVIRPDVLLKKNSMSGQKILPILLDSLYSVDIDTLEAFNYAEWVVRNGNLDIVYPKRNTRPWPQKISLVAFDFDGVFTDNRVWVDEDGKEMVAAYRSDSFGTKRLGQQGIATLVISTETNRVVEARCRKIGIECVQGVQDKALVLKERLDVLGIAPEETIYVGNDINDLGCFDMVGFAVAVSDSLPEAKQHADWILQNPGGHGAVREICDLILDRLKQKSV